MGELIDISKDKNLIYDVGMHKGEDAEFYLRKGFRVIGFEANPSLVLFCRNRLKEFIIQSRLIIVEGAILDSASMDVGKTEVNFYQYAEKPEWGTTCLNWVERNTALGSPCEVVKVRAINFLDILQKHGVPHYMKIDIEGCDMSCVRTLKDLKERPDYISIESSKTNFANIKREIDFLVDLGYSDFKAVEQSAIPSTQFPPDPSTEGKYVDQHFEMGASGLFGSELPSKWKSRNGILWQYRAILLGYYLLGDEGTMNRWKFRGALSLRKLAFKVFRLFKKSGWIPGWYDTHARYKG